MLLQAETDPGEARFLYSAPGEFGSLAISPNGKWLLVGWVNADQWLFLRLTAARVQAVSNISQQFGVADRGQADREGIPEERELVLSRVALILAAAVLALGAASLPSACATSRSSGGAPARSGCRGTGRLVRGVQLPGRGRALLHLGSGPEALAEPAVAALGKRPPAPMLLRVLDEYAAAHPEASRVGIGDLSRPHGGVFDERFGGRGHASHQNGLDVDVYYPRLDGQELGPARPAQVDRVLAQELVTRFVRAGAVKVFVGPRVGLRGPRRKVERLIYHDDHMHVRIGPDPERRVRIGRSARGRPITAFRAGDTTQPDARRSSSAASTGTSAPGPRSRASSRAPRRRSISGSSRTSTRTASRSAGARTPAASTSTATSPPSGGPAAGPWDPEYPGPRPLSEPETRAAARLIRRIRPAVTIWFHQPQALVRAWGPSMPAARRYARLAGMRFRAIRWPRGTAPELAEPSLPGHELVRRRAPGGPAHAGRREPPGPSRARAPRVEHLGFRRRARSRGSRSRRDGLARAARAGDCRRARRGPLRPLRLLPLRLVVDLNGRDGAPA